MNFKKGEKYLLDGQEIEITSIYTDKKSRLLTKFIYYKYCNQTNKSVRFCRTLEAMTKALNIGNLKKVHTNDDILNIVNKLEWS